ncbi:MAG: hypothetical protein ACXVXP_10215 [Mycobacteriaceae bacterium]
MAHGERSSDRASGALFLAVAPAAFWFVWWRPYLLLTDRELVVQNALMAFTIPLERVGHVKPGGWGVVIEVHGRTRPVMAMAVLQANLSAMLNREVRSDVVARQIRTARDRRESDGAAQE